MLLVELLIALGLVIAGAVAVGDTFTEHRRLQAAYAGTVLVALLVRLHYVSFSPTHDDSAVYFADIELIVREGSLGVSEVEHLGVELVMALFYVGFGRSGPNIASLSMALATVPAMGLVGKSLFDSDRAGLATALIVAILPIHIFYSSRVLMEPVSLFVFALVMWCIMERRWVAAGVLSVILLFMRFEYLLVTVPLALLWWRRNERLRRTVILAPFVPILAGIAIGSLFAITVEQSFLFYRPLFDPLPVSGAFIGRFVRRPIHHLHLRALYYVPQLLYWGVPFYSQPLMNPILPVLSWVGVKSFAATDRWTQRALYLLPLGIVAMFVYRELGELETIPIVGIIVVAFGFIVVGSYLRLSWTAEDPRLLPLVVLIPYIMMLSLRMMAPRYLFPLIFIGTLYAGYGLVTLVERVDVVKYVWPRVEKIEGDR